MRPDRKTQPPRAGGSPEAGAGVPWQFVLVVVAALVLGNWFFQRAGGGEVIPYSRFEALLGQGKVAKVVVSDQTIQGELKPEGGKTVQFSTQRVDPVLADRLAGRGVEVEGAPGGGLLPGLLAWFAPLVLFYLFWAFMLRGAGGGALSGLMSVGKSKARVYVEPETKVTFDDVAGVDEAKIELQEIVAFLKDPAAFGRLGARAPKGVLLVGPPGTGKTLLARAVAGQAGVPFFSISGSEFVEMFVGVGAARVRDLFEQARKSAPSIIFIDELDALGRSRSGAMVGGYDEKEQTLNQLLAEIDGFDPSAGVILLAATNRPEILDPALLRAGRFDRQVLVDRPDRIGRLAILKVHVRKIRLEDGLDLDAVAALTTGFTGADLANLVNEAAIAATRRQAASVALADFDAAIERIVAGLEKKSRVLRPAERRRVAFHEMGHALVAASMTGVDPVQKVSIVPRGVGALGYTMQRPTEDRFLLSRSELENRIAVLLGGRAAERLVFDGDISTGAADDLQHATAVAMDMVVRYGMDADLGARTFELQPTPFLGADPARRLAASEASQAAIDQGVRTLLARGEEKALAVLQARRRDLDAGVALLLTQETLTAAEFPPLARATPPAGEVAPKTAEATPVGG